MNRLPRRSSHRFACHSVSSLKRQPPIRGRAAADANCGQNHIYPLHLPKRPSSSVSRQLGRPTTANIVMEPTHKLPYPKPVAEKISDGVPKEVTKEVTKNSREEAVGRGLKPIELLNFLKTLNQPWAWLVGILILISLCITSYKLIIENSEHPFHTVESEIALKRLKDSSFDR